MVGLNHKISKHIRLTPKGAVHDAPFEVVQFRHGPDGGEGLQGPQEPFLQKDLDQAGLRHPGPGQRWQRQRGTHRTLTVGRHTNIAIIRQESPVHCRCLTADYLNITLREPL